MSVVVLKQDTDAESGQTYRAMFTSGFTTYSVDLKLTFSVSLQGYTSLAGPVTFNIDRVRMARRFEQLANVRLSAKKFKELVRALEETVPESITIDLTGTASS